MGPVLLWLLMHTERRTDSPTASPPLGIPLGQPVFREWQPGHIGPDCVCPTLSQAHYPATLALPLRFPSERCLLQRLQGIFQTLPA